MVLQVCTWLWRGVIALVFLAAAWAKWRSGIVYFDMVTIYDRIVAGVEWRHYGILAAEVLAGAWIVSGVKSRWAAVYAGLMLAGFTVLLAVEFVRNDPVLCGCGLVQVTPDGDPRVELGFGMARNVILLLGCWWVWVFGEERGGRGMTNGQGPNDQ